MNTIKLNVIGELTSSAEGGSGGGGGTSGGNINGELFIEVENIGLYLIDQNYNIGFYVDNTGAHSSNLVEFQNIE